MRLIIFILLFSSFTVNGQIIRANNSYRPFVTSTVTYIFDTYPGNVGYSLRRLKTGEDSCVRIRRSSDDAFQVIGFLSDGFFDTASFKTFVGAGTGYVQTWYDQSGNHLDAIKGASAEQPILSLNVFGSKPSVIFDGSNDALDVDANASYGTTTLFAVDSVGVGAGAENGHFIYYTNSASESYYPFVNEQVYDAFASTTRQSAGTPATAIRAKHLYYVRSESGAWQNYINNSLLYLIETNTTNTSSDMFIGSGGGGKYFKGAVSEVLIMGDADRSNVSTNINSYYTIY